MSIDIVNLRQFYASPLGKQVRRCLRRWVRARWPAQPGVRMVGVGYAPDLLPLPRTAPQGDTRILALMPEQQGAIYWPVDDKNHSVLGDALRPPFLPASLHRVLMAHLFEHRADGDALLATWWQLLAPGGRLILMVPNRHGLWARFGATPFASGTPYTLAQLRERLNAARFTLREVRSACFAPPSSHPLWLKLFPVFEWLGSVTFPRMGGVLMIEAEKQIYAGVRVAPAALAPSKSWVRPAPAMSKHP